jgi:triphosphoribosyl-dephospho-CoA synthase
VNAKHSFRRHDIISVDPEQWNHPGLNSGLDERALKIIQDWFDAGRPVIASTPGVSGGALHCGIPLPPSQSGVKERIALKVPLCAIMKKSPPPEFALTIRHLPPSKRALFEAFSAACAERGFRPLSFGSLCWRELTGLDYVRESSDADLLFNISGWAEFGGLRVFLLRHGGACANFADIEICLPNGDALSWREYLTQTPKILLKNISGPRLAERPAPEPSDTDDFAARAAALAKRALLEELDTFPKPGLVSRRDSGSHNDMTHEHFERAAAALEPYFKEITLEGITGAPMSVLRKLGLEAERTMLAATGGVNTHKGAVFSLGLLCAALGCKKARGSTLSPGEIVRNKWGPEIAASLKDAGASHGADVYRKHGCGGARAEAAAGFPSVYQTGLPALRALPRNGDFNRAKAHCFFALLERTGDSNLLHRGGPEGLALARRLAAEFNASGGAKAPGWFEKALQAHNILKERGLSPGGAGDMLAASIFADSAETL